MRQQESLSFIEVCLRLMNNNLRRFKLFSAIVLIPTLVTFVLVMWVIDPVYRALAIVTPPASSQSPLSSGLGSLLSGGGSSGKSGMGGLSAMLKMSPSADDVDVVWTIFNSWELHYQVIQEFNLAKHYKFKGKYAADLLKKFRKNFDIETNKEDMLQITVEDTDYKLAAQIVEFMLEKADSAFNEYKTTQARQSRLYLQSRLDSCEKNLKSLMKKFSKFQVDNNFYDPRVQMESTIRYLGGLQERRETLSMEMAYEKDDRGEKSKRYDQLNKRCNTVNSALQEALDGKDKDLGLVALKNSPKLSSEYLQYESEIKIQSALYQMLWVQSEEMRLEESKKLTNLHVLEPPWENNKKVYPLRAIMMIFVFTLAFILATVVCNLMAFFESEEEKGTSLAKQWIALKGVFKRNKGR